MTFRESVPLNFAFKLFSCLTLVHGYASPSNLIKIIMKSLLSLLTASFFIIGEEKEGLHCIPQKKWSLSVDFKL